MQYDDDYGFWEDDRDSSFPGFTSSLPRHRFETMRPANPLWARLGAILALGVLALPVAWMLRDDDSSAGRIITDTTVAVPQQSPPVQPDAAGAAPVVEVRVEDVEQVTAATVGAVAGPTAGAVTAPASSASIDETSSSTASSVDSFAAAGAPAEIEAAPSTFGSTPANEVAEVDPTVEVERVCANNYTVVQGDYWILIARKVSLGLTEVLAANDATVSTPLYPGFNICLPWNASSPTTAPATTAAPPASTAPATTAKATTTTAAPATTAPPPVNTYTKAQAEQIIRDVWPDDLEDEAIRIATRESNLIPTAHNWCCYGLFQIYYNANKASLSSWGVTSAAQLYDPHVNAYAAYAMYVRAGGWGPWQ